MKTLDWRRYEVLSESTSPDVEFFEAKVWPVHRMLRTPALAVPGKTLDSLIL